MELSDGERKLLLLGLFDLYLTHEDIEQSPLNTDDIKALAAKLGGKPDDTLFGADRL
jgi:hypothetical protein